MLSLLFFATLTSAFDVKTKLSQLYKAIEDDTDVDTLVKSIKNLNSEEPHNNVFCHKFDKLNDGTILHLAARMDRHNAIQKLNEKFGDKLTECINQDDKMRRTALYSAVEHDNVGAVNRLLEISGIVKKQIDINKITPCTYALPTDRGSLIQKLLVSEGVCTITENTQANSMYDDFEKDGSYVKLMLSTKENLGFDINTGFSKLNGGTLLHMAAARDDEVAILGLIETFGANFQAVTKDGQMPLHWAIRANALKAIEMLCIKAGRTMGENEKPATDYLVPGAKGYKARYILLKWDLTKD